MAGPKPCPTQQKPQLYPRSAPHHGHELHWMCRINGRLLNQDHCFSRPRLTNRPLRVLRHSKRNKPQLNMALSDFLPSNYLQLVTSLFIKQILVPVLMLPFTRYDIHFLNKVELFVP
jgi:hypothetical protein